jgi:ubiquinone/menaquinone biosynthesis C-methylase UbiE
MIFMNIWKRFNSKTCPWWLIFTFDNIFRRLIQDPRTILGEYVRPGDVVLDVGCGMGYFTMELAELVGEEGKVIAADLQEQMLNGVRRRAKRTGLEERIQYHQSKPETIGVSEPVVFALAFWMVHEVRHPLSFFQEIYQLLEPEGKFLVVEPIIHVTEPNFERMTSLAEEAGFRVIDRPMVRASRAVLLQKQKGNP